MKKIIKMFSVVIVTALISQNAIAQCATPCTALAGPDQNLCLLCPHTITLGAYPPSNPGTCTGGGNPAYTWAPTGTLSCSACAHPVATPTVTTTYTLTVTFPYNCNCDGTCSAVKYDYVTVTIVSCQPCKIMNPLFDIKVDHICLNLLPDFMTKSKGAISSTDKDENLGVGMNGLAMNIPCEVAVKPKEIIIA